MQSALISGEQVLVMLLLMAVGFACYKLKLLRDDGCAQLNRVLLYVVVPAVLIDGYNRPYDPVMLKNLGVGILLSLISYALSFAVAYLVIRGKSEDDGVDRFSSAFPNCGFMGIPLISAIIGPEGVVYASAAVFMINALQWIVGPVILTGRFDGKAALRNAIINPGTIGCAIGLLLFVAPFSMPGPVTSALSHVAALNTPLAMIVVGTFVARTSFGTLLKSGRTYLVCALKLLAAPLMMLPVYILLPLDGIVTGSHFIITACPTAAVSSLLPAIFGMKRGELRGASYITLSTIMSVATIPLVMLIKELILG